MTFELKLNDEVYYPSKTNDILSVVVVLKDIPCPVTLNRYPGTFTLNGLEFISDKNPSIFPATKEWFEKLKVIFPDLHNPESFYKLQKKELVSGIINRFGFCHVAREDNFKNLITNVIKQADQLGYYDYPINPFTLKKVKSLEEYIETPENHTIYKYCVEVMEHEPGWGSKPDGDLWFKTEEEAKDFVKRKEASASPYASYKYVGLKLYKEG